MFAPLGANSPPARRSRAIRLQLGGPAGPPNLPEKGGFRLGALLRRGPGRGRISLEGFGPPKPPGGGSGWGPCFGGGRAGAGFLWRAVPSKPPGEAGGPAGGLASRRGRNAFSPLFAPDNGGGPSGIGRGSAKTGRAPGSVTALAAGGRLSWHGGKGRAVSRAFPAGAGNGGILPQNGGVCNHENSRPCRGGGKKMSGPGKKRLTKARGYDMIILAA